MLRTKFGIELLAIYTYPAQVIFCAKPFIGLSDLFGRRVRTSSVGQSEMMTALGAVPVLMPFAEIVNAVRTGVVDCAITGTLSGNEIGLSKVTSYIYPMAISWGLVVLRCEHRGMGSAAARSAGASEGSDRWSGISRSGMPRIGKPRRVWHATLELQIAAMDIVQATWRLCRSLPQTRRGARVCWWSQCCQTGYIAAIPIVRLHGTGHGACAGHQGPDN